MLPSRGFCVFRLLKSNICFVFLNSCTIGKPLRIPFERYMYGKKRWRIGRDMGFRSSDALLILLRKLPEGCKTRPSKLLCNLSFCPTVSKIGMQVELHTMYLNPKMHRGLGDISKSYQRYSPNCLPNVTTNLYIFFQIFYRQYLDLSIILARCTSVYIPILCVILARVCQ